MLPGAFATLPPEAQTLLGAAGRIRRWDRGEVLFHPADPAETLYLLLSGAARLYRLGSGGREVTLEVHLPGALLGAAALNPVVPGHLNAAHSSAGQSPSGPTYGLYAEALDDTETLLLGREALARLWQGAPAIRAALTEQLTRQIDQLHGRLSGLVFLEVSQRLALTLLQLSGPPEGWTDGTFALRERVSHQDLAYLVGSTRETITKLLGDFRARGLLELGYRRIILTSRPGLEEAARTPLRD